MNNGQRLGALTRAILDNPDLRDAYAALLSAIRLSVPFGSGKFILVTSTQPSEGKTTVASCLAIAAALSGQDVLLIDGDLRRPSLSSAAGIVESVGFGEALEGRADSADAIFSAEVLEDRPASGTVSVMGAGQKSPEIFAGVDWTKARKTLQSISERFSLVLLDSPPVLAANDALLLANVVDGVLLVVQAGSVDRNEVRKVKAQLEPIGTPIIGAVLNQFDPKVHGRASQPYRGYDRGDRR